MFPLWLSGKESTCQCRTCRRQGLDPWIGKILEEGMATHSSSLAWRIPWTEQPGGLQSRRLQRVRYNLATKPPTSTNSKVADLVQQKCCCCCLVTQSCSTLCDAMDCSPPGSSVYGISQARILKWVAFPSPGDFHNPPWTELHW